MDDKHERYSLGKLIEDIAFAIVAVLAIVAVIAYSTGSLTTDPKDGLGTFGNVFVGIAIIAFLYFATRKILNYFSNRSVSNPVDLSDYDHIPNMISLDFISLHTAVAAIAVIIGYSMACIGAAGAFGRDGNLLFLVLIALGGLIFFPAYYWFDREYTIRKRYLVIAVFGLFGSFYADINYAEAQTLSFILI